MTDSAIEQELGRRLRALRLRRNRSQADLAEAAGLSLNAIKGLESGRGRLSSLIPVIRELGVLDQLDLFLPEIQISPLDLARRQGRERQRASRRRPTGGS
jgi:transcriptional regulator with XRE-family HTH domain